MGNVEFSSKKNKNVFMEPFLCEFSLPIPGTKYAGNLLRLRQFRGMFPGLFVFRYNLLLRYPTPYVKTDKIDWLYSALSREWTKTGLPDYLSANISKYIMKVFNYNQCCFKNTKF